ncbi:hypothetical protein EXE41_17720 [Halorubrum sp. SD690R]|nr:hypothetical protein EXE41_17720 [Halorubrum sp. SD690R]
MEDTEADSKRREEHLVDFVVNRLNQELAIDLDEDIEATTRALYDVLAVASTGGLVNHVCETIDDSIHAKTARGHLTAQFELDSVEAVWDALFQRDTL